MPESNTSEADQPAEAAVAAATETVLSSMAVNSHNDNHEEESVNSSTFTPTTASAGGTGASNAHHAHNQPHHHNHLNQHHQQMVAPQMFQQHAPHYMPIYPNKPQTMQGPYNGVMMDGAHEKETVCIYVPNTMVGAIIGKSGSAIKEMISNSGASIKVASAPPLVETTTPKDLEFDSSPLPQEQANVECIPVAKTSIQAEDKNQPESEQESQNDDFRPQTKARHHQNSPTTNNNIRKVTIVGTPDSQWSAQYMIYRKVALESMGSDVSLTAEIQVPSHFVGKIIGKSGATIKRLQKQTRTVIRLTDCRPPESSGNERDQHQNPQQPQSFSRVQITGDFNGSQLAQRQIRLLIRESLLPTKLRSGYFTDLNMPLNTINQPPYLFNNIPLPYMSGTNAQYPMSTGIVNSHTHHGSATLPRAMSGGLHHNHQMSGAPMFPEGSNYLPIYPNKQISGYNGTIMEGANEKETVCIYVPNTMVGAIIGKSGSAIKEMISNSGASIKVASAPPLVETIMPKETKSDLTSSLREQGDAGGDAEDKEAPQDDNSKPESEQESQNDALEAHSAKHPHKPPSAQNHIRKVTIVGTPDSQWSAQYMIYRKVALESMGSDVSLTAEIQVPSHLAGRIIGRSGATIKKLQKQTRTVIRLTDCRPSSRPDNENKSENKNGIDDKDDVVENGSETESKQQQQQQQQQLVDSCVQITGDFNGSQLAQRQIRNLIKQSIPLKIEVRFFSKP